MMYKKQVNIHSLMFFRKNQKLSYQYAIANVLTMPNVPWFKSAIKRPT